VVANCAADGINFSTTTTNSMVSADGNTVFNTTDAIQIGNANFTQLVLSLSNNHLTDNSGYAVNSLYAGTANVPIMSKNNRLRDNTSGSYNGFTDWAAGGVLGDVTTDTGGPTTDFYAWYSGTATAGGANTITFPSAPATDPIGTIIYTTGGTGPNQAATVTGWNAGTLVATVHKNWGTQPDASTTFILTDLALRGDAPAVGAGTLPYNDIGALQRQVVYPAASSVWTGTQFGPNNESTGTKVASSITNCEPGNVKKDVVIGDVTGTYEGGGGGRPAIGPGLIR
jgi:hypothetical protein